MLSSARWAWPPGWPALTFICGSLCLSLCFWPRLCMYLCRCLVPLSSSVSVSVPVSLLQTHGLTCELVACLAVARPQVLTAILETTLEVFEDQQPFRHEPSVGVPWVAREGQDHADCGARGPFSSVLNVSLGMSFSSVTMLSGSPSNASRVSLSPATLLCKSSLSPSLSPSFVSPFLCRCSSLLSASHLCVCTRGVARQPARWLLSLCLLVSRCVLHAR